MFPSLTLLLLLLLSSLFCGASRFDEVFYDFPLQTEPVLRVIQFHVDRGESVETVLMDAALQAIHSDRLDVLRELMRGYGLGPDAQINNTWSLLSFAVTCDRSEIALFLLEQGASPDAVCLREAVAERNVMLCREFLRLGVDFEALKGERDAQGFNVLQRAILCPDRLGASEDSIDILDALRYCCDFDPFAPALKDDRLLAGAMASSMDLLVVDRYLDNYVAEDEALVGAMRAAMEAENIEVIVVVLAHYSILESMILLWRVCEKINCKLLIVLLSKLLFKE